MAKIKALDKIADKWTRVAGAAGAEYEEGVRNPRADWATETQKAETNYEQGVQASISRKAFGKGVKSAGTDKWQRNAIEKGPIRFTQGVQLSKKAYEDGFSPFRETIAALKLPPRGPKGDPKNILRVAAVAKALHDRKLQLEGQ